MGFAPGPKKHRTGPVCKKGSKGGIVSLKAQDGSTKLSMSKGIELNESGEHIGFAMQREGPYVMGVVIQENEIK